jgi:hypothetical protein
MEIIFELKSQISPKISIILLDWSCRDSFHTLDFLSKQTVHRDQYEVVWIEYFSRRSSEIQRMLDESLKKGSYLALDKWIVMEMPKNLYYHKHLMYNMGIVASVGEIVCFCDSDAVVKPTFVESIIKAFEDNSNIVLHLDEVRNTSKKFYPFNDPSFERITEEGCTNWKGEKTTGLLDEEDPLHTRNYGACMCALRKDLIQIGGADEHIDCLGHICGPYEMTFRLVNAGKKEVWHQKEFLYHTWHPGTDGHSNYLGPHDGRNMSTTALDILKTGRVMPLIENEAIRKMRTLNMKFSLESFSCLINKEYIDQWKISRLKRINNRIKNSNILTKLVLSQLVIWMSFKQFFFKTAHRSENRVMLKPLRLKVRLFFVFLIRMFKNNIDAVFSCKHTIDHLSLECGSKISFYGINDITKILYTLAKNKPFSLANFYDDGRTGSKFFGYTILPVEKVKGDDGKIIIASFTRVIDKIRTLEKFGIQRNNIIRL